VIRDTNKNQKSCFASKTLKASLNFAKRVQPIKMRENVEPKEIA